MHHMLWHSLMILSLSFLLSELSTLTFGCHSLNFLLPELNTLPLGGLSLSFLRPELSTLTLCLWLIGVSYQLVWV